MARVKSALLTQISGNIGGLEFATTSKGVIAKKGKPRHPMTSPREQHARHVFDLRAKQWAELDEDHVRAWNAAAATHPITNSLGHSVIVSGRQAFLHCRTDFPSAPVIGTEIVPPLYVSPQFTMVINSLTFGGPYDIEISAIDTLKIANVTPLWVARWQSRTESHKPQRWIYIRSFRIKYDGQPTYADFVDAGVELCLGEHICLKAYHRNYLAWPSPTVYAWGTVTA